MQKRAWASAAAWLLIIVGLVGVFGPSFGEMWSRWFPRWREADLGLYERITGGESYYTHGPLVPLVSVFIVWMLIRYAAILVRPSRLLGGGLLVLSLILQLMACFARVNFVQGFAFIGVVAGLVLMLWGLRALWRLAFPIAFLAFMAPLPEVTIYDLNFRLKMLASDLGVGLANMVGVIAAHSGNRVFLPGDKSLVIANVCNGLRTLISLLAFGALYAYVCRLRGLWRWGLFAMTVPVALVSNAIRVAILIIVADVWGTQLATGWVHDGTGVLIYVLAFLFMFGLERATLWVRRAIGRPAPVAPLFHDVRRGPQDDLQVGRMIAAARGWPVVAVAVLVLLTAVGAHHFRRSLPPVWTDRIAQSALPKEMTIDGHLLYGYNRTLDRRTLAILETEDYFYTMYAGAGAPAIECCIIFSRDNRKGTHPPDQCLAGVGEGIIHKGGVAIEAAGRQGRIPCREIVVQTGDRRTYFLYTYKCGEQYTDSFWGQQLVIVLNGLRDRDASGAMIRLSTPVDAGAAEARARCSEFMRSAIPHLDSALDMERNRR